jgi:putative aldouronate transport system substrate-binding protein
MSPLVITGSGTDLRRMLNPQRDKNEPYTVGICLGWVQGDFFDYSDTIWDYDPLPALADYTGRGGYAMFGGTSVQGVYALTSDCRNPQLCWRLLDWMHSPEGFAVQRWGKEGVDWDYIENSEYKDMAEGNGCYGGTAKYVTYNQGFNKDARWFYWCSFVDHTNFSLFVHPTKDDYVSVMNRKAYQNVATQLQQPRPEDELVTFSRTPEEDELFFEFNEELSSVINTAKSEFIIGIRDPKDDAQWQAYLNDLKQLKFERWQEFGQNSYERQLAEIESLGK